MTIPPPKTLSGTYELAVHAYAVATESSRQDDDRNRQYRARVINTETDASPTLKDKPDQQAVAALQRQVAELQATMEKIASDSVRHQPATTSTTDSKDQLTRPNPSTGTNVICYYCHQPGYIFRICPKKKTRMHCN
jgi:leucyl aminopeptidase (aminopeptidase T)